MPFFKPGDPELQEHAIMKTLNCCPRYCLLKHFKGESESATNFVVRCFREYCRMNSKEKKKFILEKVQNTIQRFHGISGYADHLWTVGPNRTDFVEGVCKECFLRCYDVSKSTVIDLVKQIKEGAVMPESSHRINARVSPGIIKALKTSAEKRGHILSNEQLAALRIPSTVESLHCYSWMHNHFKLVGDLIPNSDGEVHIESVTKQEIWKEYKDFMITFDEQYVELDAFRSIWKICFEKVKVRKYKAVTGDISLKNHFND